ncbi:hypothetical protein QQ045_026342 [Rhodiola kirilowii]
MNGPIISIARELGFEGNPILEGLVVSIFISGAFIGSLSSGAIVDKLGCRRTLQLSTLPLIIGALLRLYVSLFHEFILIFVPLSGTKKLPSSFFFLYFGSPAEI